MAKAVVDISCDMETTNYVRLDKDSYPAVYDSKYDFSKGMGQLREGEENILLTSGVMYHVAANVANSLKGKGVSLGVIDIFEIPINQPVFLERINKAQKLITLEEHFLAGGLGSAICELLTDEGVTIPLRRIGIEMSDAYKFCYKYGGRGIIRKHYGIDAVSVEEKIAEFIGR
jgi:transketolase